MNRYAILPLALSVLTASIVAGWGFSQDRPNPIEPIEVQTRGPLHEAYAQPFSPKPEPGTSAPKEPPSLIPEEPPEQKPEAENAQWIPGYWAWDSERQEYIWISGVYRVAPQGRTFVPGYWTETADGWRWIAGFWASQKEQSLPYSSQQPPAPLDNGPSTAAPDDNAAYIPGVWIYRDGRWLWRPGYWAQQQAGRVWISPRYVSTPNGYLFIDGYWDYPLEDRGLIFAPVYFNRPLWTDPSWVYQPSYVVSIPALYDSSFVQGGNFYFGNYYGPAYARLGYQPWYNGLGRYDPAFNSYRLQNQRGNPNWLTNVQKTYTARANGQLASPPTSIAQLRTSTATSKPIVAPLNQGAKSNQVRLVTASTTQLNAQKANAQQTRTIALNRRQLETAAPKLGQAKTFSLPTVANATATKTPGSTQPKTVAPITNPTTRISSDSFRKLDSTRPSTLPSSTLPKTSNPTIPKSVTPTPAPKLNSSIRKAPTPPVSRTVTGNRPVQPHVSATTHRVNNVPHRVAAPSRGASHPSGGKKR